MPEPNSPTMDPPSMDPPSMDPPTPESVTPASKQVVLELCNVTFRGNPINALHLSGVDLVLHQGEMILLQLDRGQRSREVASMLQGLHHPLSGEVRFQNCDWRGSHYDRHFQMRSRIGRVFDGPAWIQNLNLRDNVTSARSHHGDSWESIQTQYLAWIRHFQVTDASGERPSFVEPAVLQVYQWIRALLGRPSLLILERPMQSVAPTAIESLVDAVNELRRDGTAVLWLTSNPADYHDRLIRPITSMRLRNGLLVTVAEGASHE